MYGTVARIKVRPGSKEKLMAWSRQQPVVAGQVATYVYQSDKDPNELWLCVIFENKEAYFANANSPEQNERFSQMVQFIEREPDWHDGEVIYAAS
jgi:quinol monooxygenase YgiN